MAELNERSQNILEAIVKCFSGTGRQSCHYPQA